MKRKPTIPKVVREEAEDDPAGQLELDKRDIVFLNEYAKHKSLKKAANKAFGGSNMIKHRDPVKYGHSLMTRKAYDRAVIDYWANLYGCTDAFLIRELAKGIMNLQWKNAKQGLLKLKCMHLMMELKRMLPDKDSRQEKTSTTNIDKMQQIIIGDGRTLSDVISNMRTNVSEEELQGLISGVVEAVAKPAKTKNFTDDKLFASRSEFNQGQKGDLDG